jgi:hypothetical protein
MPIKEPMALICPRSRWEANPTGPGKCFNRYVLVVSNDRQEATRATVRCLAWPSLPRWALVGQEECHKLL